MPPGGSWESIPEFNEAARAYYALYSLPGADAGARERGLAGLANVLLTAPEQPIAFGAGDLSLYKDIATMDRHPGFLNGILSLVLNTAEPRFEYNQEIREPSPISIAGARPNCWRCSTASSRSSARRRRCTRS